MAGNYDGDIKLSVGLDASKTKFSLKDLVNSIKKAFSSGDSQIKNMGLQMQKLKDNIDNTQKALDELKNTKAPTKEFTQLNKELDATKNKLSTARSALKDLESSRVPTAEYQRLTKQLEDLTSKSKAAKLAMEYYEGKGNTAKAQRARVEYEGLEKQVQDTARAIVDLEQSGKQFADSPAYTKKAEEVKQLEREVTNLEKKIKDMKASGLDIDFNTKKIQATEQKLGYLRTQANIMTQKFKEATTHTHKFGENVKSLATKTGNLFKNIGQHIKKNTVDKWKDSTRALRSNLKQIFRNIIGLQTLIRVLRTVAGYAKEAFKDMAKQYPDINAQLSNLLSNFEQFKHSVATVLQPLLSVVLPILNTIIDAFITAANAVGSFFAALTGQGFIYKAVKQQKNFAGAVKGTGGAAKEAKEELAEYDKLIVISSNDAGSGGGGGGGAGGGGSYFEQAPLISGVEGFINKLKRMWREADFTELGEELGQKIIQGLNSIPWDMVKEVAVKLAKSIATFLNGLISPELFESLAHTVAEALNTAFLFLKTFGETFEWKEFGESIGRGITKFFRDADFAMWGDTVHTWLAGILDAGIALVDNTDWALLGTRIGEFIANLDIPDLVGKLATLAFKIISGLAEAIINLGAQSPLAGAIVALLTTVMVAGKLGGLASAISTALGTELTTTGITLGSALPVVLAAGILFHITKILWKYANGEYDSIQDLFYDLIFDKPINIKKSAGSISEGGNGIPKKPEAPDENKGMWNYYTDKYGLTTPELWDAYEKELAEWEKTRDHAQDTFSKFGVTAQENKGMANYYTNKYGLTHADLTGQTQKEQEEAKNKRNAQIRAERATDALEAYEAAKTIIKNGFGNAEGFSDWYINDVGGLVGNYLDPVFDWIKGIGGKLFGGEGSENGSKVDTTGMEAAIGQKVKNLFKSEDIYKGVDKNKKSQNSLSKHAQKTYEAITSPFKESGAWAKGVVDDITKNFATMPGEVENQFKGAYTKSTDEFKGINQWAKNVEKQTSTGFDTLPSDVEQRYRKANSQGRAQFDGSQTWAQGVTGTIDSGFSGLAGLVKSRYNTAYNDGTSTFNGSQSWASGVVSSIGTGLITLPSTVKNKFSTAYSDGTSTFNGASNWAKSVANSISTGLNGLPSSIQSKFTSGYNGAKTESNSFMSWIKKQDFTANFKIDVPTQSWLQDKYNKLAGIWSNQTATFNITATSSLGGNLNSFVAAINNVIDQVNKKLLALKNMNVANNITTLSRVKKPALAKGGVIPPNQKFLALLGDQTQGTNIETPLETMVEAFNMALATNGGGSGAQTINVNIDGRQVAQVVWDANERKYKQTGRG